jgi:DNA-binding XRE family transcriptional regulator
MKHIHALQTVQLTPSYDIGIGFRRIRQSRRLSQQAVADALKISRNSYIAWEANKVDITLTACIAFCELFSIDLIFFLTNFALSHDPAKLWMKLL